MKTLKVLIYNLLFFVIIISFFEIFLNHFYSKKISFANRNIVLKENNPNIIDALVKQAILDFGERNISYITFKALKANGILNQAFSRLGFFNADKFSSILNKKSTQSELHILLWDIDDYNYNIIK